MNPRPMSAPGIILGLVTLLILSLTSMSATAQGTSTVWVPAKPAAQPVKEVRKPAEAKTTARPAAPKATATDDSVAIRLQQRLDQLERVAEAQSAVILALQARVDSTSSRQEVPAAGTVVADQTDSSAAPREASAGHAPPAPPASPEKTEAEPAADSARAPAAAPTIEELVAAIEAMTRQVDSLEKEIGAVEQRGIQRVSGLGNFRFAGDVRMRYESTIQAGGTHTRHRERTRARFHITGAAGSEITGGLSIATGADNEPQTENQTHTGFFTRKTMAFERFFINYKPKAIPGLSLTAGKFPTPWTRTQLTFSSDLYPEGVAGAYRTPIRGKHVEEVSVVGFWLPMLESSGGPDSYLSGGQVSTKLRFDSRSKASVSVAVVNAVRADAIATAVAAGTFKPSWPTSNTVRTDSTGKVLGFEHGFRLNDVVVSVDRAFTKAWPVAVTLNAVQNANAPAGNRTGFLGEVTVGSTSAGKAQYGWSWYRIERDAVISAFNVTDIRLGSNSTGYIAKANWRMRSDLVAGFTGYFGRILDPTSTPAFVAPDFRAACKTAPYTGCRDPNWSRLQFDVVYSF